ncbi:MAG: hypothetical protein A3C84_05105 [Candidatus Ryanbacteria bacterium RIFCSPHIGHO2_02_FULL_48_12]|uniref:RNHCP domain-containing protein n=1 Tax=Candidatus Ryanbacteria bacterium RIFCSPHIGHO2_01_FULL_48_27 TaxID=1802115 RepID=A0A1G2G8C0_9BACT|nr:MAG: hypothetical protein A2756_06020 [Candidatus Ryanbacteria bacterium RIFCSPHIGHO2_01_FULL_48_27]OGZ49540.1 MAG: hypothetical protein A3C84_05105 [Candidatus Ryanbacteria bacterium RIFCSPHIGHO2_02_FULL_48_12]
MEEKKFQRKKEDFICKHCGFFVSGNGYTNHCPQCLWSRHVDINPGDRAAMCEGMMEPVRVELDHGEFVLVHRCRSCGFMRRNKVAPEDDLETLVRIGEQ